MAQSTGSGRLPASAQPLPDGCASKELRFRRLVEALHGHAYQSLVALLAHPASCADRFRLLVRLSDLGAGTSWPALAHRLTVDRLR